MNRLNFLRGCIGVMAAPLIPKLLKDIAPQPSDSFDGIIPTIMKQKPELQNFCMWIPDKPHYIIGADPYRRDDEIPILASSSIRNFRIVSWTRMPNGTTQLTLIANRVE